MVKISGRARGKACADSHRTLGTDRPNQEIMNHSLALSVTIAVMRLSVLTAALLGISAAGLIAGEQESAGSRVSHEVFAMPDGGEMTYGISVPDDAQAADSEHRLPLILALHPGGGRTHTTAAALCAALSNRR